MLGGLYTECLTGIKVAAINDSYLILGNRPYKEIGLFMKGKGSGYTVCSSYYMVDVQNVLGPQYYQHYLLRNVRFNLQVRVAEGKCLEVQFGETHYVSG